MVTDVVSAKEFVNSGMNERFTHVVLDAREHDVDALFLRRLDEYLEVVDGGRVDEGHLAHAYDAHLGLAAEGGAHHLVKLGGHAEEERAVYLVDLDAGIDVEHLVDGRSPSPRRCRAARSRP